MVLSEEADDEHHNENEDIADQVFLLEEALGATGDPVSDVGDEAALLEGESLLGCDSSQTSILNDVDLLNRDDLDDGPDDAQEAAHCDGDDLCGVAHDAVAGSPGQE